MTSDPQKNAVYRWELRWADWNRTTMSLAEARDVVAYACEKYDIKAPRVTQHKTVAYSYSRAAPDNVISFRATDQRNAAIALHETAHFIDSAYFGDDNREHHNPQWMGIYMWLLEAYRVAPRIALRESARIDGILWASAKEVGPSALRKRGKFVIGEKQCI